jgi:hypothetical protein
MTDNDYTKPRHSLDKTIQYLGIEKLKIEVAELKRRR